MKSKILILFMGMFLLIALNPNYAYAKSNDGDQVITVESELLRKDVIVTKYRVHNGYFQYRHWNETQGYWVEDYWITIA